MACDFSGWILFQMAAAEQLGEQKEADGLPPVLFCSPQHMIYNQKKVRQFTGDLLFLSNDTIPKFSNLVVLKTPTQFKKPSDYALTKSLDYIIGILILLLYRFLKFNKVFSVRLSVQLFARLLRPNERLTDSICSYARFEANEYSFRRQMGMKKIVFA